MANVKELKKKIKSTKSTLKTTTAMKLVSAAKLARSQERITNLKPYAKELEKTIATASALTINYKHTFFNSNPENKQAYLLVISANKGLCGSYNSGLAKTIHKFIAENSDTNFKLFYIGKKVRDVIEDQYNSEKTFAFDKSEPSFDEIRKVADELSHAFTTGEVGKVYIAYNIFNSAISFTPTVHQVLPMGASEDDVEKLKKDFPFDFKYEPSPESILNTLIPEVYINTVYTAMLDAIAAEHGSRMAAMENATKNSKEMIRKLTLKANKLRQAAITTELIEVVSGAESLNG